MASAEGKRAAVIGADDKLDTYRLLDESLAVLLVFAGGQLTAPYLSVEGSQFGASWDDWSEKKELARQKANDRWLQAHRLPPGQYGWGTVHSTYDAKAASSTIAIDYAPMA